MNVDLDRILPAATRAAWSTVAAVLPGGAYLAGGTAVAVHLGHRQSRDLDVFVARPFDTARLRAQLEEAGSLTVTLHRRDTLNGVLDGCRVQFLEATTQQVIDPHVTIEAMPVAGLRDLLADKLKVVGDRGELRDYFDLMAIEQQTPYRCECGFAYYRHRYRVGADDVTISHILRGLAWFDDVADDPSLPTNRAGIEAFWRRRARELHVAHRAGSLTHGVEPLRDVASPALARDTGPARSAGRCGEVTGRGGRCRNRKGSCPHHRHM